MRIGKWFAARKTGEGEGLGNEFIVLSLRGSGLEPRYDTIILALTLPVWRSGVWEDYRRDRDRSDRRFLTLMFRVRRSWRTHNWHISLETLYLPRED